MCWFMSMQILLLSTQYLSYCLTTKLTRHQNYRKSWLLRCDVQNTNLCSFLFIQIPIAPIPHG